MPDPANVFGNDGVTPPVENTNSVDKYADLLKSIKNENGEQKYDTLEKALEALGHSQTFIPQIKSQLTEKEKELERIKAELEQRESVEEVMQRLIANNQHGEGNPPATSGLDEQAVMKLVQQTLNQSKQSEVIQNNQKLVQEALSKKFGEKASEVVAQKANELGTTPKELGELASKNPNLILALFNTQGHSDPTPTRSSVNISAIPAPRTKLERPQKSILSGATTKDQKAFMEQVRAEVYAKHGIDN